MKETTFKKSSVYFDTKPIENSDNAITSGAVFECMANAGLSASQIYELIYPSGMTIICGDNNSAGLTKSKLETIANVGFGLEVRWNIVQIRVGAGATSAYVYGVQRDVITPEPDEPTDE